MTTIPIRDLLEIIIRRICTSLLAGYVTPCELAASRRPVPAVHGLEGSIRAGNEAITYYKDPHELAGKCNSVMANPPFNVDEVDAEKVKGDKRLPFGLPGVSKSKKVSNANYLWLQYFYSYLN